MIVVIPSRERADALVTLKQLPPAWRARTRLMVHERERETYQAAAPDVVIWTHRVEHLAAIRDAIVDVADDDQIVMLDDDLKFYVRRQWDPPRLRYAAAEDYAMLWGALEHLLGDQLPLIGLSNRIHNDADAAAYTYNARVDTAYAVYRPTLARLGFRFGPRALPETFHLNLTLLRAGYTSVILRHWAFGQAGSNTAGGCSVYRTAALQAECMAGFAAEHAPFVKVVHGKKSKSSWEGMEERDDVVCQWAAAAAAGRRLRGVPPPAPLDLSAWLPKEALLVAADDCGLF